MKALDELRAAGATVVIDEAVLPESFARHAARISTYAYVREDTDLFLHTFGPPQYHSAADCERVVGAPLGPRSSVRKWLTILSEIPPCRGKT
jgi:amidase